MKTYIKNILSKRFGPIILKCSHHRFTILERMCPSFFTGPDLNGVWRQMCFERYYATTYSSDRQPVCMQDKRGRDPVCSLFHHNFSRCGPGDISATRFVPIECGLSPTSPPASHLFVLAAQLITASRRDKTWVIR